eukprot:GHVU01030313.1.p1 GENE.GHVU01030313.1~~GHVU01030313.1.p1  ORF type:complete len:175 (-),score=24.53 GHVU01030313.1:508-1032(-)
MSDFSALACERRSGGSKDDGIVNSSNSRSQSTVASVTDKLDVDAHENPASSTETAATALWPPPPLPPPQPPNVFLLLRTSKEAAAAAMLRQDPSLASAVDKDGHTLLHWASLQDCHSVVRVIVEECAGAIDPLAPNGQTPLMWAAARGRVKVMAYLLANGANPHVADSIGACVR